MHTISHLVAIGGSLLILAVGLAVLVRAAVDNRRAIARAIVNNIVDGLDYVDDCSLFDRRRRRRRP